MIRHVAIALTVFVHGTTPVHVESSGLIRVDIASAPPVDSWSSSASGHTRHGGIEQYQWTGPESLEEPGVGELYSCKVATQSC